MAEEKTDDATKVVRRKQMRRLGNYAAIFLSGFLLALIPMWLSARGRGRECEATHRALGSSQIQNMLASAAITAQHGDYEEAHQLASQFFMNARGEIDRGSQSALTEAQRENIRPMLSGRDEIITLLARAILLPANAWQNFTFYIGKPWTPVQKTGHQLNSH